MGQNPHDSEKILEASKIPIPDANDKDSKNPAPESNLPKILVVEDEPHLAFNIELNLKTEGFSVVIAPDGPTALKHFAHFGPFDLIVLDVMLPEINGFDVAKTIRKTDDQTQILMLTAMGRDQDRVRGFEAGVDDYLTKPFHLKEFVLRVKRMVHRSKFFLQRKQPETAPILQPKEPRSINILSFGPFSLNFETLELTVPQKGILAITALEADILKEFFLNPDRVLSRSHLLQKVWGMTGDVETRTVDNFIVRLRRYIETDPAKPVHLISVRGRGYKLNKTQIP